MGYPIYDSFNVEYKKPFGAVERYEPCGFTLRFPKNFRVEQLVLVMFRPGFKERHIPFEQVVTEYDFYDEYYCEFMPMYTGLHHYYFALNDHGGRRYIKRRGDTASIGDFSGDQLFQLTVYEEGMETPDWLKGGIMYQIFPDRFARSSGEHAITPIDRKMHDNWAETPDFRPDAQGLIRNNDYFGGELKGIEEKLDYLVSLGVTVIYLNPIFEAHENHRYNTAFYERIDPMLGTEADFVSLCKSAKEKGIRIILDGVFSHTGADSVYFNKFGRYGESSGAFRDWNSPYREWYSFINYPNTYESWWGITTLPNVNENNPAYTNYICGEGGILQKWLDLGASGWRLDVADELPDEFIDNLNKRVKAVGADKVIYGEVWEDASNKESYGVRRRYLVGGQLDSVMNYPFKEAILNYIKSGDPKPFVDGVMTILEHYPKPSVDILMNFLSTHDTERAITRLAGDEIGWNDREWQAEHYLTPQQYVYGVALMKCAMVLQYFLPGIPCIYYGDEAAQQGYKDPFNRRTYPWGNEDLDLVYFARALGAVRKSSRAFEKGELKIVEATGDYCIFARIDREIGEAVAIYLNKSHRPHKFRIVTTIENITHFEVVRPIRKLREAGVILVSAFDFAAVKFRLKPEPPEKKKLTLEQEQQKAQQTLGV